MMLKGGRIGLTQPTYIHPGPSADTTVLLQRPVIRLEKRGVRWVVVSFRPIINSCPINESQQRALGSSPAYIRGGGGSPRPPCCPSFRIPGEDRGSMTGVVDICKIISLLPGGGYTLTHALISSALPEALGINIP